MQSHWRTKAVLLCALAALIVGASGCSYVRYRVDDALEIIDLGVTISKEPQVGLYWNSLYVWPFGYSNLDGWFAGWGGGQVGVTRHFNQCAGFGYARETIGWGEFDKEDPDTYVSQTAGVLGLVLPPYDPHPAYTPACVHFFPHIGFVGLVWNARYTEMLDFVLGFTTIDIAGDDGYAVGRWAFPQRRD
ncbi:MAG: hypothetical protein R6V05_06050 [Candidatus Brocadiia bacterium]